jgi:DNA-binding SARP family transcriptional activator
MENVLEARGAPLPVPDRSAVHGYRTRLAARIGDHRLAYLLAVGRAIDAHRPLEPAISEALENVPAAAAVTSAASLRVHLLGRFRILKGHDEAAKTLWGRPQALAILEYLLLHRNRAVPVDELVEAFWPEAPSVENTALYTRLSQLRRGLQQIGGALRRESNGYRLDLPQECWLDIDAFEQALAAAARAAGSGDIERAAADLEEALSLYEGDLLGESPYSEWAALRRDALRQKFLEAAVRLAAIRERTRNPEKALALYAQVLASEPFREEAHRGLMRLYAHTGRRDLALRQYRECVEALRRELDAGPSIETELLREAIREGRTESPSLGS